MIWRDRRSVGLLLVGLFFLLLALRPIPAVENAFAPAGSLLRYARPPLAPFGFLGPRPPSPAAPERLPNAKDLAEKEAAFWVPADPALSSRRVLFASLLARDLANDRLVLAAGSKHGVRPGMAAVRGDSFVSLVSRVEEEKCVLDLPAGPDSRLGARAGEIRLVAAGLRGGRIRVELPSGRHLNPGEEVFLAEEAAAGARLGRLVEAGARTGERLVAPAVDPKTVQAVWLLGASPEGPAPAILPAPPFRTAELHLVWADPSARGESACFVSTEASHGEPGSALVFAGRLVGKVARVRGEMLWANLLGDPRFEVERLLLADGGEIVDLGRGGFEKRGEGLALPESDPRLKEGWLFTGAGDPLVPKGIPIGRVKRRAGRFFVETARPGIPERCDLVLAEAGP